jgi:hypothetical protein
MPATGVPDGARVHRAVVETAGFPRTSRADSGTARHTGLERQLATAEEESRQARNPALPDYLPVTAEDLAGMPDEASRRPFEALRLEIRYAPASWIARSSITLTGDAIDALRAPAVNNGRHTNGSASSRHRRGRDWQPDRPERNLKHGNASYAS